MLKIPGKNFSIPNSSDILRYIYGLQVGVNPEKVAFLKPSEKSVKWEKKIDKMGEDLRQFVYYQVIELVIYISVIWDQKVHDTRGNFTL